jgi:hypothetical protein
VGHPAQQEEFQSGAVRAKFEEAATRTKGINQRTSASRLS